MTRTEHGLRHELWRWRIRARETRQARTARGFTIPTVIGAGIAFGIGWRLGALAVNYLAGWLS